MKINELSLNKYYRLVKPIKNVAYNPNFKTKAVPGYTTLEIIPEDTIFQHSLSPWHKTPSGHKERYKSLYCYQFELNESQHLELFSLIVEHLVECDAKGFTAFPDELIKVTDTIVFTKEDSQAMANLIYRRFGKDLASATKAWRRLLENNTTEEQFKNLLLPCDS